MTRLTTTSALLVCFAVPLTGASAAPAPHTPSPGSSERKAIMDGLRPPVMKWYKSQGYSQKVIFKTEHLKVSGNWAYFAGSALKADGKQFDDDFLCGGIDALLRKQGKGWKVLDWGIATDVSVGPRLKRKFPQAPRSIFPYYGPGT